MNTPRFTIGKHSHGQTAIFDSVGLVCTMEAGSQSKRDTDAAYIIKLEADRAALIAALEAALGDLQDAQRRGHVGYADFESLCATLARIGAA